MCVYIYIREAPKIEGQIYIGRNNGQIFLKCVVIHKKITK